MKKHSRNGSVFIACGLAALLAAACASAPEGTPDPVIVAQEELPPAPAPAPDQEDFDPSRITREEFDTTIADVRQFIEDLNRIVRGRDYDGWVAHLGPSYFAHISSREFLLGISQSSERLKARGIVLADARDYFVQVVVPSRANDRVDDIEFISYRRVKAYTINSRGQRLRLYDLENVGNGWRIIN